MNTRFDLSTIKSYSEIPACRGPEVLFSLIEVDPISGKESEQYPDAYPKEYRERVEKFSRNYIWRKMTGEITIGFLEAAVERMFNADEVSSVVDLERLKRLKHQIVGLFFTRPSRTLAGENSGPDSIMVKIVHPNSKKLSATFASPRLIVNLAFVSNMRGKMSLFSKSRTYGLSRTSDYL
jgi:hypothetical protein